MKTKVRDFINSFCKNGNRQNIRREHRKTDGRKPFFNGERNGENRFKWKPIIKWTADIKRTADILRATKVENTTRDM